VIKERETDENFNKLLALEENFKKLLALENSPKLTTSTQRKLQLMLHHR